MSQIKEEIIQIQYSLTFEGNAFIQNGSNELLAAADCV